MIPRAWEAGRTVTKRNAGPEIETRASQTTTLHIWECAQRIGRRKFSKPLITSSRTKESSRGLMEKYQQSYQRQIWYLCTNPDQSGQCFMGKWTISKPKAKKNENIKANEKETRISKTAAKNDNIKANERNNDNMAPYCHFFAALKVKHLLAV